MQKLFVTSPCSNLFKIKYCILSVVNILWKNQIDVEEKEHKWIQCFWFACFLT